MSALAPLRCFLRVSLRELLGLCAFLAVSFAALRDAGQAWWLGISSAALLLYVTASVVSFAGSGGSQKFAQGIFCCMTIYGVLIFAMPRVQTTGDSKELDPYAGSLPTTWLLGWVYELTVERKWIDFSTGKEIPNYDPSASNAASGGGFGGTPAVTVTESPLRNDFMAVGHLLWALLLGCIGGRMAWLFAIENEHHGDSHSPGDSDACGA